VPGSPDLKPLSKSADSFSASYWLEVLKTTQPTDRNWKKAVSAVTKMG
jgi:hypothetical protein